MTFDPATPAQSPIGREVDRRVDPIVAAVLACPLVAGLHGGRYGQIATYLPGRRVTGIRITEDEVAIHLVACYPSAMDQVAREVRSAVAPFTAGLAVHVTIEDLNTNDVSIEHDVSTEHIDGPGAAPARPTGWIVIDKEP